MSRRVFLFVGAIGAFAGAAVLAANNAPSIPKKLHAVLQIKPGLWEFSDKPTVTGDTIVSDAMLARMPSSQRAQYVAQFRAMMAQQTKERECISQATFELRLFVTGGGCKQAFVSNTANRLELQTQCQSQDGAAKQVTARKVVASSPTAVTTSFHAVTTKSGRTMTVDSVSSGHLVSPNCGNVHTIEQMQ